MAGAGYKLFNTGDVLTAAQVNTYLQEQTVMVFASSTARTTALSGVLAEGMVSYLQDTNAVEVYNGSAWVGVSGAGDITEVQAGVGISIASGTGPIPVITNSSTDLITTAGDLLYGTAADTMARLGIGTAGQVLKVNSGATAPEWGAAGGGTKNFSLLNAGGTSLSGSATVTVSGITNQDMLWILVTDASSVNITTNVSFRFNADATNKYKSFGRKGTITATTLATKDDTQNGNLDDNIYFVSTATNAANEFAGGINVFGAATAGVKTFNLVSGISNAYANGVFYTTQGIYTGTSTISSVSIISSSGNFDAGTIFVYGAS